MIAEPALRLIPVTSWRSFPMRWNRGKQRPDFERRLASEAARLREKAGSLPVGIERDLLLRKARQAETASRINEWLSSPGLRSPAQP